MLSAIVFSALVVIIADVVASDLGEAAKCGACRLLIQELEYSINEVDPKKTIEVGSFRVDPQGNQKLTDIPYARSEVHIHELLEKVCDRSERYGIVDHPTTGRRVFAKLDELLGSKKQMIVETTADTVKRKLKSACENMLEEHEDDLVIFLKKETKDPLMEFCYKRMGFCDKEDLVPIPQDRDEEIERMVAAAKNQADSDASKADRTGEL